MTEQAIKEPPPLTDVGNGRRFAERNGGHVKFIHRWNKWLIWNGRHWEIDESGEVDRLAKLTAQDIYNEAAMYTDKSEARKVAGWAHGSQSLFRIAAMLTMAKSEQPVPLDYRTLDNDGWQLNCENGVLDLKTGKLDKHRPADFITMTTGVEYPSDETQSPLWDGFLQDIFESAEMIAYVQRLCGVSLIGGIVEHILPMAIGCGANGKSVFTETLRSCLGDYAMAAPAGLLMTKRQQSHSTEVADLFRKRLVIVSETNDGASLDEGLVKSLTGGDAIRARRMREDFWEFDPTHTLLLVTNHRPVVKGRDTGIWRRLRMIPFLAQIPPEKQNPHLTTDLKAEFPAILRWMVNGCLAWQQMGLNEPQEVLLATDEYKNQQDILGCFITDRCLVGNAYRIKSADLYQAYRKWCEESGESLETSRKFKSSLEDRGLEIRKSGTNWIIGITLSNT